MSNILSPEFKYTDSAHTDIRVLFERVRKELEEKAAREEEIKEMAKFQKREGK